MDSELEAGYLTRLFTEPVYMMGYETANAGIFADSNLQVETVIPKPKEEVKKTPDTPILQVLPQKISIKCILLFFSEEDELKTGELEFLSKIMKACTVLPSEYECVNFRGITITDLASRYAFSKLVLFNVTIPGLTIGQYKCTQVKTTQIISADDVWMLESNVGLKKQLWEQLQVMFGLVK
jgi:hypothetical protein